MICQPCALAADKRVVDFPRCAACKRQMTLYPASRLVVIHKVSSPNPPGPRVRCPGSAKAPLVEGHDACTGCDCQHHPVKEK